MKKQLFLFFALLIFSFHYCNDKIQIYKNELKEIKSNTVFIQKKYNDKVYNLKVSIGEGILGKVSSFSIEVMDGDNDFEKYIVANKEKIKTNLLNIISKAFFKEYIGSPVPTTGGCYSTCTKKWECYDKPTEAGTAMCALDCALECLGA